jgi:hypothetical protein
VATTYRVRLIGGPCGGTTKTLTQAEWESGETTCKGAVYVYDGITRPAGQLPHLTYRPGAPPPPPSGGAGYAPHTTKAWGELQKQVNRTMPSTLRTVSGLQAATSTALRRRRRVRH